MKIIPMPGTLGARVQEIDLSLPLMGAQTDALLLALGRYGYSSFRTSPSRRLNSKILAKSLVRSTSVREDARKHPVFRKS